MQFYENHFKAYSAMIYVNSTEMRVRSISRIQYASHLIMIDTTISP